MKSLLILGRQPFIGTAELESLYGPEKIKPIGSVAVEVDVDPCLLAFDRLGGSVKFAKVLTEVAFNNWEDIEKFLIKVSPGHAQAIPPGKMLLGISAYGFSVSSKRIVRTAVNLKQAIRATGRSVRVIPNNSNDLSSAQVIHNHLTGPHGWELLVIKDGPRAIIAQTVKVQDISAYASRDQKRPARDPKIGMLPPKLAQIIINLAVGLLPPESMQSICAVPPDDPIPAKHFVNVLLLDSFCGTGVLLQEALIMGYDCIGTDIDPRMIDYSKRNLEWLTSLHRSPFKSQASYKLTVADAESYHWPEKPTVVACEIYLGRPLSRISSSQDISPIIDECNQIISQFLTNIAGQIDSGTRLCLAVPSWLRENGKFVHLPLLDSLEVFGYNRVSFQHSGVSDLVYFRRNQVVARELLVLTRK